MITKGNMTLFFAAHDPLSNWYIADFQVKNLRFNCVEQFMMFCKAKLFGDEAAAAKILAAPHPKAQKAIGRTVAGYDEATWVERRSRIVALGCYAKFSQNPALKEALLETGESLLVEASPWDRIWGVGLGENDPRILDQSQWQGLNLLGQALSEVRSRLAAELSIRLADEIEIDSVDLVEASSPSMRMG